MLIYFCLYNTLELYLKKIYIKIGIHVYIYIQVLYIFLLCDNTTLIRKPRNLNNVLQNWHSEATLKCKYNILKYMSSPVLCTGT